MPSGSLELPRAKVKHHYSCPTVALVWKVECTDCRTGWQYERIPGREEPSVPNTRHLSRGVEKKRTGTMSAAAMPPQSAVTERSPR